MQRGILFTVIVGIAVLGLIGLSPLANADTLNTVESQITSSIDFETTPTLARDGVGLYVVYTSQVDTGGGLGPGDVFYQRLNDDGTANGPPVVISGGAPANNVLNDASGDFKLL